MDPQQSAASGPADEATFDQEWNVDSPARVFANTLPPIQRAWERQPRPRHIVSGPNTSAPVSSKPRIIWKRYDQSLVLKQVSSASVDAAAHATKVVKKLKLAPDAQAATSLPSFGVSSKLERRRSSLPHKSPSHPLAVSPTLNCVAHVHPTLCEEQHNHQTAHVSPSRPDTLEASTHLVAIGEGIPQLALPDEQVAQKTRRKLSRSSLLNRRKTDFTFSRAPILSPSRKRRLSDTQEFTSNSVSVAALPKLEPYIPNEAVTIQPIVKPTNTTSLDQFNGSKQSEPLAVTIPAASAAENAVALTNQLELAPNTSSATSAKLDGIKQTTEIPVSPPSLHSDGEDAANSLLQSNQMDTIKHNQDDAILLTPQENGKIAPADSHSEAAESSGTRLELSPSPETAEATKDSATKHTGATDLQDTVDDSTSTIKITVNDDDTDILHEFLNRAKASKAAKIAEQSAVLNRRDSDIVKNALASPRKPLEDLDTNSPSPKKPQVVYLGDQDVSLRGNSDTETFQDKSVHQPNGPDLLEPEYIATPDPPTRRSKRNTHAPPIPTRSSSHDAVPPSTISLRRQDQSDPVVLKKSEAQELALLTRTNTRRNKGGALPVRIMLERQDVLATDDSAEADDSVNGQATVRWNDNLVTYFQENNNTQQLPENSNILGSSDSIEASKPRARRAKTLGAMNGTPAKQRTKGLGASTLLLDSCEDPEVPGANLSEPAPSGDKIEFQALPHAKRDRTGLESSQASDKESESFQKQPSSRLRRIPTPAKPAKVDVLDQVGDSVKTRLKPVQAQKLSDATVVNDDKENKGLDLSAVSKHETGARNGLHLRSGIVPATRLNSTGEAWRRSDTSRKVGVAGPGATSNPRAAGRLRR